MKRIDPVTLAALFGVALLSTVPIDVANAQKVGTFTVDPALEATFAAQPQDARCHIMPVQPGYGVRSVGQPGWGKPAPRPECDVAHPGNLNGVPAVKGTPAASDMNNHGGPVVPGAASHFLYVNSSTGNKTPWGDPVTFLQDLYKGSDAKDMIHILDQYVGTTTNGRYTVFGEGQTNYPGLPHIMTEAQIQAVVKSGIDFFYPNGGGGGTTFNYHVFLMPGQDTCFDGNTQCYSPDVQSTFTFCGYHKYFNTTDKNGVSIVAYYSVEPFMNVSGCSVTGGPNGALVDSQNNVFSHEIFELSSDPALNAWYRTSDGQEIGDVCNFNESDVTLNSRSYRIQKEYSNTGSACLTGIGQPVNPPSNDNFANAPTIAVGTSTSGTNASATQEAGEPNHAGNAGGQSVWWKFTPAVTGTMTISTGGSTFDTLLAVYTGSSVGGLSQAASDDDCTATGSATSCVTFKVTAGVQYHIAVDGYYNQSTTHTGSIVLGLSNITVAPTSTHDYNGDGFSDIMWRDGGGTVVLWQMSAATVAANTTVASISPIWSIVGQRDFSGDGKSDILWRDQSGNVAVWLMNGATTTSAVTIGNIPANWNVVGTGDFDGDHKGDILWRDGGGNVAGWFLNGTAVVSVYNFGNIPANWNVVGVADLNGDGKSDILWRDGGGNVAVWFMNGSTVSAVYTLGNIPANWSVVGTGDFDGDGKMDFLWRDGGGNVAVWFMNGSSIASVHTLGNIPANWFVGQTGDYNRDGKSDILWRDGGGNVAMWFMNGASIGSVVNVGNIPTNWTVQGAAAD